VGKEELMFIGRNQDGSIYGMWTTKQWDGQEEMADDDPNLTFRPSPFHNWNGSAWVLDQAAKDAADALAARVAIDDAERLAAKVDAQILGDINMDAATVATTIDALFAGAPFTNGQRTYLKRLTRMAQIAARAKLRNGA